jgi:hypothetical protein
MTAFKRRRRSSRPAASDRVVAASRSGVDSRRRSEIAAIWVDDGVVRSGCTQ